MSATRVVLEPGDERAHGFVGEQGLGRAEGDVKFVKRADGLDLRMILRHPLAVEQARRAVVAGASGDGVGHRVRA